MEFYKKASSNTPTEMVEKKDSLEVNIKSGKKIRACISQAIKTLQVRYDSTFKYGYKISYVRKIEKRVS